MKKLLFIVVCFFIVQLAATAQADKKLTELIATYDRFMVNEFSGGSISAIAQPLGYFKESDFARRYQFYRNLNDSLSLLPKKDFSFEQQINLELLRFIIQNEMKEFEFHHYRNGILSDDAFHIDFAGITSRVYTTEKDLRKYLDKLRDFPRFTHENLELIRSGLAEGIAQPAYIIEGLRPSWDIHIVNDPSVSLFFKPFLKQPMGIADTTWTQLVNMAKKRIMGDVVPTYQQIKTFFETEYLPKARKQAGVGSSFPNGKAFYQQRVQYFTSTSMTVDEVHQLGLKEVARIEAEMQAVMNEVGFKGSLKNFIEKLRTDPQFYPKTADELLQRAAWLSKKAEAGLPALFGKLPRQPFTVAPVPDYLAPSYTGGRYSGAPITSKSAGAYWVNTYKLDSRPFYTLESLTLHEAVPGHHLQTALAQELTELPRFRQNLYVNAFGEGWGLYSEYLGYEMGFYKDPYNRFGRLTYEMWRACRLVVDTGIHGYGWSREQAIDYLGSRTALSVHEVNTEINRYISWPGQALSYKIGEIKIKALRQRTEKRLGEKFDIRAFHDLVLSQGSVTLSVLETMVDNFMR
ncbi:MAG: DUF885 domain-containing protein [Saprospiraceae bacterium]|nr:DUF885 domain-containing protein [Saprospiraceae bacterium]